LQQFQLDQINNKLAQFLEDVTKFHSPGHHFTKKYRALITESRDLQVNLDRIKINESLQKEDYDRKKMLICAVTQAVSELNSKVHETGELCKGCPIQNI